ncbi:efflux RND transporter periplasmic adaptor subunit [Sphingomonas aurantiaca]|uniref:efflux RND transporter periplasmic adaptor subunit n=1 Tax=Sphingomonas aurantiaca TaxID=185949 RepID=UPI003A5BC644
MRRGDALAIIESREAASLNAEIEAARARSALAQSNLRREQRLFAERVSPEQDLIAARTAATEANIAVRLAQQQLSATGGSGGALNRVAIRSPLSGQIIARSATLGQTVAADGELYRVANLSRVTIAASLSPADAGKVKPGTRVEVTLGRPQAGRSRDLRVARSR